MVSPIFGVRNITCADAPRGSLHQFTLSKRFHLGECDYHAYWIVQDEKDKRTLYKHYANVKPVRAGGVLLNGGMAVKAVDLVV